jgi:DNA-binding NarL/FixJ family response regulator
MQNHTRPTRIVLVGDEGNGDEFNTLLHTAGAFHYELCHARDETEIRSLGNEFDLFLLDMSRWASNGLALLERVREEFASVPVIVIVWKGAEMVLQQALRLGAAKALVKEALDSTSFAHAVAALTGRASDHAMEQERLLEQALNFLQQHRVVADAAQVVQPPGLKPLCETMPSKFLELTKSYSNLLDLALTRTESGIRFNGYSVSRRLHFLASDLGALHAGVWDVIDMHVKAVEGEPNSQPSNTAHKILLELISDLVSYYKHSDYVPA